MEDCKVKAAHPLFTQSNEDWVMWAILHMCGRSETIIIPRGSKAPRKTSCLKKAKKMDGEDDTRSYHVSGEGDRTD